MREQWKNIPGFEGYIISSYGHVQSCRYGSRYGLRFKNWRPVTLDLDTRGKYLRIDLVDLEFVRKSFNVARLVYEAFVGPIPIGYEIDHIDRNPVNNFVGNLRLATRSQNIANTRARNSLGNPKGIRKTKAGNWEVKTTKNGQGVYLGTYKTLRKAREVFSKYARKTYGDFACTEDVQ